MPIDDLFRAALIVLELGILEPRAQIKGGVVIFDLQGIGLHHAWQVSPSIAAKVIQLLEVSRARTSIICDNLRNLWTYQTFIIVKLESVPAPFKFHIHTCFALTIIFSWEIHYF